MAERADRRPAKHLDVIENTLEAVLDELSEMKAALNQIKRIAFDMLTSRRAINLG